TWLHGTYPFPQLTLGLSDRNMGRNLMKSSAVGLCLPEGVMGLQGTHCCSFFSYTHTHTHIHIHTHTHTHTHAHVAEIGQIQRCDFLCVFLCWGVLAHRSAVRDVCVVCLYVRGRKCVCVVG